MNNFEPRTNVPDYHSVITIQLLELVNDGLFSWTRAPLNGCFNELDEIDVSIKTRLQAMFIERNEWREISITPYLQWAQQLAYKIKYELVPKYKPLYTAIADEVFNPTHNGDEYYKERIVDSSFPETLLSGTNESYLTNARDHEHERIAVGNALELAQNYYNDYYSIDEAFMNELDSFFIDLWTVNANVL